MSDKENKIDENGLDETEGLEEDGIIELVDDDGKVINFRLLDVTEYKGLKYVLLLAAEPNEEIAEDEVVIFRLNEESEILEPVEDEKLLEEVFEFYQNEVEESDDGEN